MKQIDINCDMGESFGRYAIGDDDQIMPYISSCNIACGFHAGDPLVIKNTVLKALSNHIGIGAHPSYPDLQGFGRRSMSLSGSELEAMIVYQVSALKGITETYGGALRHVKPHGALYNDMAENEDLSRIVVNAIGSIDPKLSIVGLAGSAMHRYCEANNIPFRGEFFADRNYTDSGLLVSRSEENAIIHDPDLIADRTLRYVKSGQLKSVK
ncbi:MAG: 5-oxoprolinase subunit PxpA, partial [Cyclobacteriaceae bacterium]